MNRASVLVLGLALLHAPSHAKPSATMPAPTTVSPFWSPPGWPQKWLVDGSQPATPAPSLHDDGNTIIEGGEKGTLTPSPVMVMVPAPSQDAKAPGQSGEKPGNGKGVTAPGPSKGAATPAPSKGAATPAPSNIKDPITPAPSKGTDTPTPSKGAGTPAPSKGAATPAPSVTKDPVTPAPTNPNGGKPHHDGNPPPNNGGSDKNPTSCAAGSVMVSVEGRGSFCVSSAGAVCAGDNAGGRCPKKQPGLEKGSYCGKVRSGVFGCLPGPGPVKKCDAHDEKD